MEEYKKVYPVSVILDCFGIKRSTFYRWKVEGEKPKKRDEVVEKIELICMGNQFIYGYRTITRLLKKRDNLVTDMTYLYFGNCKLYLSSIMDLYNREIVAYTISDCQDTDFVLDTLNQLNVSQGALLHSDQGSVYTSKAYYQACTEKGITRSMSRKGTPADNACIEWFHSVLKSETFYLHNWRNLTKDSRTDIVKSTSYFIMKLEFNRDETTGLL